MIPLLSPVLQLSGIDFLDLTVLPDDHRRTGLFRTLDDLPGGLLKSGIGQFSQLMLNYFFHNITLLVVRSVETAASA